MRAKRRQRRDKRTFSCGHPRTPENTRVASGHGRTWGRCRICNNNYMRVYMRQRNLDLRVQVAVSRALDEAKRKEARARPEEA